MITRAWSMTFVDNEYAIYSMCVIADNLNEAIDIARRELCMLTNSIEGIDPSCYSSIEINLKDKEDSKVVEDGGIIKKFNNLIKKL